MRKYSRMAKVSKYTCGAIFSVIILLTIVIIGRFSEDVIYSQKELEDLFTTRSATYIEAEIKSQRIYLEESIPLEEFECIISNFNIEKTYQYPIYGKEHTLFSGRTFSGKTGSILESEDTRTIVIELSNDAAYVCSVTTRNQSRTISEIFYKWGEESAIRLEFLSDVGEKRIEGLISVI